MNDGFGETGWFVDVLTEGDPMYMEDRDMWGVFLQLSSGVVGTTLGFYSEDDAQEFMIHVIANQGVL